jgi:large subunit ribosomal protein L10
MAKTRQAKELTLQDLSDRIANAKSMVFANFQGLKVKESDELRALCRTQKVGYLVSKKTLVRKALKDRGLDIDATAFEGGVSVLFGNDDEVAPAQVAANFAKTHEAVRLFGGVLEGAFIDGAKVSALSRLPSKQQLLGQLVGTLNAPVSGFVNVLAGNLRGLVTVLSAIKDKQPS